MHTKHIRTIASVAILLLVTACTNLPPALAPTVSGAGIKNANGYVKISPQQLAERIDDQDLLLLNVHIPYDGDLPQTDLSIPYNAIAGHLDELPEMDAPIVVYCLSGGMSTIAAKELVSHGYTNVIELDGGMGAWVAAGYDLVRK